ncbi:TraX family protein [Massilia sp. TSP1-1-2]|uniref:TraX family protein n=1 Tax=Massilia sp. TSP1-1-2 TaxID=2804649 RepID=UPI003CEDFD36
MYIPGSSTDCPIARGTLPRLITADGALEAVKWLALFLMTGDHINKYLFNGTKEWLFDGGRIAMPLFVFVLAYNLARPGPMVRGAYHRTVWRLVVIGCFTMPVFVALGGLVAGWWPLNIMFTLAAICGMLMLLDRGTLTGQVCAAGVFLAAGALVEFLWSALALGLAIWLYCRHPSWCAVGLAAAALAGFWYINGNHWALVAVPIALVASGANPNIPRMPLGLLLLLPRAPGLAPADPDPDKRIGIPLLLTENCMQKSIHLLALSFAPPTTEQGKSQCK